MRYRSIQRARATAGLSLLSIFAFASSSLALNATFSIALCGSIAASVAPQGNSPAFSRSVALPQVLAVERTPDGGVHVDGVELRGQCYAMDLAPRSIRARQFRVLTQDALGFHDHPAPEPRTFQGRLVDDRGSERLATAVLDDSGRLTAWFSIDGDSCQIEPSSAGLADEYVATWSSGLPEVGGFCGVERVQPPPVLPAPGPTESPRAELGGVINEVCKIAFDTDYEFFQENGSSVDETMHDIESVMLGVTSIYEACVGITYEVTTIIVRTDASDPYSSTVPGGALSEFRFEWTSAIGHPGMPDVDRNVAHMMTGKDLVGNTIGFAYFDGICNSFSGYGLSQSRYYSYLPLRAALTAHELGHNWSAEHCSSSCDFTPSCNIMCPCIGSCSFIIDSFSSGVISQIASYRNSVAGCLQDFPLEFFLQPFFSDRFVSTAIDPNRWSYARGAGITSSTVNAPDLGPALVLDASGPEEFLDDEIRSNELDLGSVPSPESFTISYSTQHRGVEAGEQLVVEYFASDLVWRELERLISDGTNQTQYESHVHPMPADAIHSLFRLRFRTEVDQPNDDWFIDMVRVGPGPETATPLTTPRLTLVDPAEPLPPGRISVASMGDRNGDGRDDFAIGYPERSKVLVYSGLDSSILAQAEGMPPAFIRYGAALAPLGSVGGCVDLLIGAPGDASTPGSVSRICGGLVFGSFAGDEFGFSVAAVGGDLDGDGVKDYIVGAPASGVSGAGYVRVFSGQTNAVLYDLQAGAPDAAFGYSVSGAGDVNADGTPDILVGAPYANLSAGAVYVFSGTDGTLLRTELGTSGDLLGWSVSDIQDIDSDGFADFIAGVPGRFTSMGPSSGSAIVLSGASPGVRLYEFFGDFESDHFGVSVDGLRDIDHDGVRDVIVGAPGGLSGSGTGSGQGTCKIFSGATGAELYRFRGESAGDLFGNVVSYGGKVAKKDDLQVIVAAPQTGTGDLAKAYVFKIPNSGSIIMH